MTRRTGSKAGDTAGAPGAAGRRRAGRAVAVPRSQRGSRERGERMRARILEAVVQVIARDGVRGVTHRAVAAEAGVSLSLTTYYFVDRYDLVANAFAVFVGRGREDLERRWQRAYAKIDALRAAGDGTSVRVELRDYVAREIANYAYGRIVNAPLGLAVEQHIFSEVLLDPRLTELAAAHRQQLIGPLVELCRRFGSDDPELDADLLLGTILRLEYESLLVPREAVDRRRLLAALRRMLGWILRLP